MTPLLRAGFQICCFSFSPSLILYIFFTCLMIFGPSIKLHLLEMCLYKKLSFHFTSFLEINF